MYDHDHTPIVGSKSSSFLQEHGRVSLQRVIEWLRLLAFWLFCLLCHRSVNAAQSTAHPIRCLKLDALRKIAVQSIESGEFGPMLDWLEEQGLIELRKRISKLLGDGEPKYVSDVYLNDLNLQTLEALDQQALIANRLLDH